MRLFTATLESISPYGQSRYHGTPEQDKELPDAYEKRTWREKAHVNDEGYVFIPATAFKNSLSEAAKYLGMSIPGKGKQTYTKNFEAGTMVTECLTLPVKKEETRGLWLYVPSDGRRGGSRRVHKCFPVIDHWKGDVNYYILDDTITLDVFKYHIEQCGKFIGIGMSRPRNNGFFGRFGIISISESSIDL